MYARDYGMNFLVWEQQVPANLRYISSIEVPLKHGPGYRRLPITIHPLAERPEMKFVRYDKRHLIDNGSLVTVYAPTHILDSKLIELYLLSPKKNHEEKTKA